MPSITGQSGQASTVELALVSTLKGRQIMYFLSEVLTIRTDLCTVCIGGDRSRVLTIQAYVESTSPAGY